MLKGIDIYKWGHSVRDTDLQQYPELTPFLTDLHEKFAAEWKERQRRPIADLVLTLAGHGNIPPWAVFHPRYLWAYIAGTVYPYAKVQGFDFEKGKAAFPQLENPLTYDGMALLMKPWHLGDEGKLQTVMELYCFNPAQYSRFLRGETEFQNNMVFRISYGIGQGRRWLHVNADTFDITHHNETKLLETKPFDVFCAADPAFVTQLERVAPLPLYMLK